MQSVKSIGRIIGLIFLVRMLLAPVVYFRLLPPVTGRDYLANAAGSASEVRAGVLLASLLGALSVAVLAVAAPVLRRHSEGMTLAFAALSVVGLATLAAENVAALNMLSLSQEYARAGGASELLRMVGRTARSTWSWAHFTNLIVGGAAGVMFNAALYRSALVPRALAALALAAGVIGMVAVTMPLLGYGLPSAMLAVTALGHLALTLWLIVRGFEERQGRIRRELTDHRALGRA